MPYARWHHERFDGKGYPDGKGGHEVPLSVALVAVCDCWDAITEPRPYRTIRPFDEAVEEMRAGAGRQWSRVLVEWLIDTVSQPGRTRSRSRTKPPVDARPQGESRVRDDHVVRLVDLPHRVRAR